MLTFRPSLADAVGSTVFRSIVLLVFGRMALGWSAAAIVAGAIALETVMSKALKRVVVTPAGIRITSFRWRHRTYRVADIRHVQATDSWRAPTLVQVELTSGRKYWVPYVPTEDLPRINELLGLTAPASAWV